MDYSSFLIDLQHSLRGYRKAMLAGNIEAAKQIAGNMLIIVSDLEQATKIQELASEKVDDLFHATFPNAIFPDDTAIHVWRTAWKEFLKHSNS